MNASPRHILVNALSMGSGGGFTVGREILRNLAITRPDWRISCALISAHPLHEQLKQVCLPSNAQLLWAPSILSNRAHRQHWERTELTRWSEQQHVDGVIQLNGMLIASMRPPTLCHMQDPWPYRAQAWVTLRDRIVAALKRREHRYALKHARCFGWTSAYLRDLICQHHGIWPKSSEVLYNGVPREWIERAQRELPDWNSRPNEILTVSNVNLYKRQSLVIRAMPQLLKLSGLQDLIYRIVGEPESPRVHGMLIDLARRCGVSNHVIFEGRVSDDRVKECFARAKCYVLMSVCESFGIPAIEAMSFGTPVVTADCCAMPEVCGDAALLAAVDDVNELVKQISRVLLNPQCAQDLRQRGSKRVEQYNWINTAQAMVRLLERSMFRP